MSSEKILNTRIGLKFDTLEHWSDASKQFALKKGEVAFASVASAAGKELAEPVIMAKIGDGTNKTFNELPWAFYANAADVYQWAKAPNKPNYTASEIGGLADFIGDTIQDTDLDTRYAFTINADGKLEVKATIYTKGVVGTETTVATLDFVTPDELTDALKNYYTKDECDDVYKKIQDAKAEVGAANQTLKVSQDTQGVVTATAVDIAIESKQITDFDEAIAGATVLEAEMAHMDGDGNDITVTYATKEETAISIAGIQESISNLPTRTVTITETTDELPDGIAKKYTFMQDSEVIGTINLAKELVVTSGTVETVKTADTPYEGAIVGDKYIVLTIANQEDPIYIPAKDLVDVYTAETNAAQVQVAISDNNVISATLVNGGVTEEKLASSVTTKLNKTWEEVGVAAGLVSDLTNGQVKTNTEAIAAINDTTTGILASAKGYVGQTISGLQLGTMSKETASNYYTRTEADNAFTNAAEVDSQITAKLNALNLANTYAEKSHTHEISDVTGLQTALDGKANDAALSSIAKTGSTDDLVAGTEVWIFDCGGASEN